ncbi:type II toxin-antitoxin system tRNA(fMet)-specific endonuclease VapC [Leptospira dzoumogneensis]|uniref:Type II toxin-antitoxin system VapC family toxin n=1 Tax=Leptospira dzoumogneensis TaxID=2484904 RepID=A0A4Z1AIK6_9LEPT|nr:type II toxin-antitoxin system VapC family toxin [Leptospira dzoumogneensis]TGN04017.1 type II toxin-antitoxin system VapC family toxin [Leptospira dzoumogneensis]
MNKYLLDTNICIYIINRRPDSVYKKFKKAALENIYISSITEFELYFGIEKSLHKEKNRRALADFIGYLNILPFDSNSSTIAAKLRFNLEKSGKSIGPFDLLIASQAISNDHILVTNNEKEFKRIKELKLENWL